MAVYFINKSDGNDKNAIIRAFSFFIRFQSEQKSIVFNDRNNFNAILDDMSQTQRQKNKMWNEKKISFGSTNLKVYTMQTLPPVIRDTVMTVYLPNKSLERILSKNYINDILAIPWTSAEVSYLKSIGAIEI